MSARSQPAHTPAPAPYSGCEHESGCITCADLARPMRVLEVSKESELAVCADEQGRRETVDVGIVTPVAPGDSLLVHAGTALHRKPA